MGYETDPTKLTFALAVLEMYGKDYKVPVEILCSFGNRVCGAWIIGAGPDWIKVRGMHEEFTRLIPVSHIIDIRRSLAQ